MEKLAHNQIYSYLQSANILTNSQHGFRPLHSTVTALLKMSNQWYQNMDEGLINGVVFLDLKKAFDTVDHNILLKKLHLYGVRGRAYDWFKSYLSNRTQYCQVNGNLSESRTIITGIPQGSILGPLLFLIYILSDLPNCLKNADCEMFADDTQIGTANNDAIATAETLNEDLENISVWMAANKLSLNKSKTEFMLIGSHQKLKQCNSDLQIKIGDTFIQRVTASKSPTSQARVFIPSQATADPGSGWHVTPQNTPKSGVFLISVLYAIKGGVAKNNMSFSCMSEPLEMPKRDK